MCRTRSAACSAMRSDQHFTKKQKLKKEFRHEQINTCDLFKRAFALHTQVHARKRYMQKRVV
jgi:hypothetical protein